MPPKAKKMSEKEKEALRLQEEEERLRIEAEEKRIEEERIAREEEARRIKEAQIDFRTNEIATLAVRVRELEVYCKRKLASKLPPPHTHTHLVDRPRRRPVGSKKKSVRHGAKPRGNSRWAITKVICP